MAFRQCLFFDITEVTKIVLPKVLQNFKVLENCTCWPKELNQNGIFFFFRVPTIPGEAKGSPSRDCLNFLHAAWKHAG